MSKLEKCPFCGREAAIMTYQSPTNFVDCNIVYDSYGWVPTVLEEGDTIDEDCFVESRNPECGAMIGVLENSDEAIKAWNRRAQPNNPPLTCRGCAYFEDDAENEFAPCRQCKRMIRVNDFYRHKPEGGEG